MKVLYYRYCTADYTKPQILIITGISEIQKLGFIKLAGCVKTAYIVEKSNFIFIKSNEYIQYTYILRTVHDQAYHNIL